MFTTVAKSIDSIFRCAAKILPVIASSTLLWFGIADVASAAQAGETKLIEEIEFVKSKDDSPPTDPNWQPVTLPLFKASPPFENMNDQETLWFRVALSELLTSEEELQSLYIWRHNMRLSVYLEDVYLGGTIHRDSGSEGIGWNHPILVDLPLNVPPSQFVYIKIEGGPGGTVLSPLMSGSRPELVEQFEARYLLQIRSAYWSFFLCLLLVMLSIWLWAQRRREILYLHFAAMSGLSALTMTFFFLDFVPVNLHVWLYVQHTATDWIAYFMICYVALALDRNWQRTKTLVLSLCFFTTTIYVLLPAYYFQPVAYMFDAAFSLILFFTGFRIIFDTFKQPNGTNIWFSVAFCGFFIINLHDFSAAFLSTPEEHIAASNWLHLNSPLMALAFFAHLVHRFISALEISEQLNRVLEQRVEQTRRALEESYAENREMELKSSVEAERQKIYRELHDDLGSKQVSIVHSAEGSRQSDLARGALESLRESIYKARHNQQTLSELLSAIELETRIRLEGAGVRFNSQLFEVSDDVVIPSAAYNLTRILREGVSNLLQHSNATEAELNINRDIQRLNFSLVDNGNGGVENFYANSGLSNMKFRAEKIGADLNWATANPGCRLVLQIDVRSIIPTPSNSPEPLS